MRALLIVLLLSLALPAPVEAAGAGGPPEIEAVVAEAEALTAAGRPAEALALMRGLLEAGHRAPKLLFETGRTALAVAEREDTVDDLRPALLDEAVLLLRIVLQERPAHVRARFVLARALFLLGEDDLARRQFERVLASRPPPEVADPIRRFLAIPSHSPDEPRRWFGYIGAALGYGDNIGSASDDKHIWMETEELGRQPFARGARKRPQSGPGLSAWGGLAYEHPLNGRLGLRLGADTFLWDHASRRFDGAWLGVHAGPRWRIGADADVSLLAEAERQWSAGRVARSALGLRLEAGYRPTERLDLHASVGWRRDFRPEDDPDDPDACLDEETQPWDPIDFFDACIDDAPTSRDGPGGHLSVGAAWMATPDLQLRASLGHDWERPKARVWRNRSVWGRIGAMLLLPEGFVLEGGVELRRTHYGDRGWREGPHFTGDGKGRRDRTRSFRASLGNSRLAAAGFDPELAFVHEVNATNAQAEDYHRNGVELRFTRRF